MLSPTAGYNIELKARYHKSIDIIRSVMHRESAEQLAPCWQEDYYFHCCDLPDDDSDHLPRFKLRAQTSGDEVWECCFIWYARGVRRGPNESKYRIAPVTVGSRQELDHLVSTLDHALGLFETVKKNRQVWLCRADYPDYPPVRVHYDEVADLGFFVELEAIVSKGSDQERRLAVDKIEGLVGLLEIEKDDLVRKSYADQIVERRQRI